MKTNKLPFIRWYSSDFLAGIRGLKAFEIGIYTVLINEMYERCEPLPENIERLAWQCGCTKPIFIKTLNMLKSEGKITTTKDGLWNNRVEKEFIYRQNKILVATQNINARWEKHNKNKEPPIEPYINGNTDGILSQKPETIYQKDIKELSKDSTKKPKGTGNARQTRIPFKADEQMPAKYREYAEQKGLISPDREFENWVDWWISEGTTKLNWLATWRGRVRTAIERKSLNGGSQQADRKSAHKTAHSYGLRNSINMDSL